MTPPPGADGGFAWRHLRARVFGGSAVLRGHEGEVYHVEFAPDGRTLASCGQDRTARLWDAATLAPQAILRGHQADVNWVAFAPDGTTLATAGEDATVRVWDRATGRGLATLRGHAREVEAVVFTPDGRRLVSGGRDGRLIVWDPARSRPLAEVPSGVGEVQSLAVARRGRGLAAAGEGVVLFELTDGAPAEVRRLAFPVGYSVHAVALSDDGRTVATGGADRQVLVFEAETGRLVRSSERHTDHVEAVGLSPDGQTLASAGNDRTVRVQSLSTGPDPQVWVGHERRVWGVAFSPDGHTLASCGADGLVRLWGTRPGPAAVRLEGPPGIPGALAFSPDGATLVVATRDGAARVLDLTTGSVRHEHAAARPGASGRVVLSADGSVLAAQGQSEPGAFASVSLGGERAGGFRLERSARLGAAYPDGSLLVALDNPPTLARLDGATGRLVGTVGSPPPAFWPAGRARSAGVVVGFHTGPPGAPTRPAAWDEAAGRLSVIAHEAGEATTIAVSDDGRRLAAGDPGGVHVFDVRSRRQVAHLAGREPRAVALAFAPDGRTFATAHDDGSVWLWDLASGVALFALRDGGLPARALLFSPEGSALAAAVEAADARASSVVELWRTTAEDPPAPAPGAAARAGPGPAPPGKSGMVSGIGAL